MMWLEQIEERLKYPRGVSSDCHGCVFPECDVPKLIAAVRLAEDRLFAINSLLGYRRDKEARLQAGRAVDRLRTGEVDDK